jgi:ADP-ribose pyrophosphatase YjhB (NUDIX family)
MGNIRNAIRADIAAIVPHDALEAAHQADALAWLDSGVEVFRLAKPATPPKHLVAYFMVVDADHVLLVDHIKAGLWLPPGGHVEPNEPPRFTVEREVEEELGLKAQFVQAAPLFITVTETVGAMPTHTDVSLWYVLQGNRAADYTFAADEFHGIRWFPMDALPLNRCDPYLTRFVEKYQRTHG